MQNTSSFFQILSLVLFCFTGGEAVAQPRHMIVSLDEYRYNLVQEHPRSWRLTSENQQEWDWEIPALVEGSVRNLSLQADGEWLILSGVAARGTLLAGELLPAGPFLAMIDRADGSLVGLESLECRAEAFEVLVANGRIGYSLTVGDTVLRHYLPMDQMLFQSGTVFIVDNGGTSSDPGGGSGNGGSGTGGTGSGTGSGTGTSTEPETTTET